MHPGHVKVTNIYPTVPGTSRRLRAEIWQDPDPGSGAPFLVVEDGNHATQRVQGASSKEAAIAIAREWGYSDLVESADRTPEDRTRYLGKTRLIVTTSILVPQETQLIHLRDFRIELIGQLPGEVEFVLAEGIATLCDEGGGSYAPSPALDWIDWVSGDKLHDAIRSLPTDQQAWIIAVMACGDIGVSIASFSRVS